MSIITVCALVTVMMAFSQAQSNTNTAEVLTVATKPSNVTVEMELTRIRSELNSHRRRIERLRKRLVKMRQRCCRRRGGGCTGGGGGTGVGPGGPVIVRRPRSCVDIKAFDKTNSVHTIVVNHRRIPIFCDQKTAGGGWTVIQRRMDGKVDFRRNYTDYQTGFGNLRGEFFLGLDKIYRIASFKPQKLRIDMEDFKGTKFFAEYCSFSLGLPEDYYRLNVTGYNVNSTAGNSLSFHNNAPFSTYDSDNDNQEKNCAKDFGGGGWWYPASKSCHQANLNGLYMNAAEDPSQGTGISWYTLKNSFNSLKRVEMKLRPYSGTCA